MGAGAERGARLASGAVMIGFLFSWVVVVKAPWMPVGDVARIGHIAFGATVLGLALDLMAPKRWLAALFAGGVVLVSAWGSVTGRMAVFVPSLSDGALVLVLAAVAFLILARLDAVRTRGVTPLVLLTVAALGVSAMAVLAGEARIASGALVLALAVAGFAGLRAFVALPVGDTLMLGGGVTLLALAWALGQGMPQTRLALLLIPLVFFAESTAQRVPLPKARISTILYPLVLTGVAALPCALAILVTYVTMRG